MVFISKKDSTRYAIVFEIGSGSVAGAIISSNDHTESPMILYSTREFLPLKQNKTNKDINKRLLSIFLSTALDIESKLSQYLPRKTSPTSLYINFTAPWSYTRSNVHIYESEKPTLITEKLLEEIKKSSTDKSKNTATSVTEKADKEYTVINRTILGHTVNNYHTSNPIGQTGTRITTTETVSAVINSILNPIEEIIEKIFTNIPTHLTTSPLIQQLLLRSQTKPSTTFATIHLTYEAIELTLYRNEEIVTAFTAPIGINSIARDIAQHSKIPHEQIFSLLTQDDVTLQQPEILIKIQESFETVVQDNLVKFFSDIRSSEMLPHDFFLVTTRITAPVIVQLLTKAIKKTSTNKFVLHNFKTPQIHSTEEGKMGNCDVGICTMAYFFHNTVINN